ncbi:ESCRT-II complex subunit-domain-containing protein [Phlyctochytrium arcticum]|nr:ESCRT-II complex subunit-domain-containing protein [Phlyctochytrium arcticum]
MATKPTGYTFPSIHDFPPFFTIQPTQSTRQKQIQLWCEIILGYCAATGHVHLDLGEVQTARGSDKSNVPLARVFLNPRIQRNLSQEGIRTVVEELAKQGHAEWESPAKNRCLILWRKPEEWANIIYKWAFESGSTNSICTVYELLHGDGTVTESFHGLDERTMVKALEALAKSAKAQLFTGQSLSEMGVKFF